MDYEGPVGPARGVHVAKAISDVDDSVISLLQVPDQAILEVSSAHVGKPRGKLHPKAVGSQMEPRADHWDAKQAVLPKEVVDDEVQAKASDDQGDPNLPTAFDKLHEAFTKLIVAMHHFQKVVHRVRPQHLILGPGTLFQGESPFPDERVIPIPTPLSEAPKREFRQVGHSDGATKSTTTSLPLVDSGNVDQSLLMADPISFCVSQTRPAAS